MPLHWRCVTDNASSESKNNTFLKFLGLQVARRHINTAVLTQGRVGHTHNRQDASFAQVASVLSRSQVLETPADFKDRIEMHLKDYTVELLHASYDFQSWLGPVTSRISGMNQTQAANKKGLEACHVYKLMRREPLPPGLQEAIEMPPCLAHEAKHPQDVILFPKLYMASPGLSQPPMVFMAWADVCKVPQMPSSTKIPRHPFSDRQSTEFVKTATLMKTWGHDKAHDYLVALVARFLLLENVFSTGTVCSSL